jgi:hypothetical protein
MAHGVISLGQTQSHAKVTSKRVFYLQLPGFGVVMLAVSGGPSPAAFHADRENLSWIGRKITITFD